MKKSIRLIFYITGYPTIISAALIGCLIFAPFRLYDWAFETNTDWRGSPYSYIASLFQPKNPRSK